MGRGFVLRVFWGLGEREGRFFGGVGSFMRLLGWRGVWRDGGMEGVGGFDFAAYGFVDGRLR